MKAFEQIIKKDLIPIYILTNFNKNDQPFLEARATLASYNIKDDLLYHKSVHLDSLISDIKRDVIDIDQYRMKKKYSIAFEAFENDALDSNLQINLFKILDGISGKTDDFVGLFNAMRQMYEMILHRFVEKKLPADYFYGLDEKGRPLYSNLSKDTKKNVIDYLNGNTITVAPKSSGDKNPLKIQIKGERITSPFMEDLLKRLYQVLSNQDHYNPGFDWAHELKLRKISPHFFEAHALLLLDLIIWAKEELEIKDINRYIEKKISPLDSMPKVENSKTELNLSPGEKVIFAEINRNNKRPEFPIVKLQDRRNATWKIWDKNEMQEIYDKLVDNKQHNVKLVVRDSYEIVKIIDFID